MDMKFALRLVFLLPAVTLMFALSITPAFAQLRVLDEPAPDNSVLVLVDYQGQFACLKR
jgi:hypothetical protein